MAISLDTTTLNKVLTGLQNYATKEQLQKGINNCALLIERDAKLNCPVDTGNLRASISTTMGNLEAEVGTNVEYAAHVEFGTRKQPAKPFLYPAYLSNIDKLSECIIKAIKEGK